MIRILGTGMAGFGAAYRLRQEGFEDEITMYDKNSYFGGHTASFETDDGFIFDDGPHISFTDDERLQKLLAENIDHEYETLKATVNNYWRGHWIKHPAQCNLHGLPSDLIVKVIEDFIEAKHKTNGNIKNYKEWLYAKFGKKFAETFPMVYGKKYHTVEAENMDIDWLGPRLYQPELEEVLKGALEPSTPDVHYVDKFRYPTNHGFVHYLEKFKQLADIKLDHKVTSIEAQKRLIHFDNGKTVEYDEVISSIPLPEMITKIIEDVPNDVLEAGEKLACTSCIMVNIGIDNNDFTEAVWSYFYDTDIIFTRLSFPHLMSPNNVPPGCGSIQAEIYFSDKYRPVDRKLEDCVEPVIADLKRCGLIKEEDKILHKSTLFTKYANVIFDLDRQEALKIVHGYLDDIGIRYCGRYGDWGYQWTDQAFKSGEEAAQGMLDLAKY
ncbi:NAD(P)-binding protein [Aliifodinibius sp. S!AR15-10]|uniref:protoporphyrinogen/coproporphyrinogen oxidase n=1 Tax=Aliifodinibius sp. S!AR15-10 TaxID=2950437 RepID=UPI002856C8FE|nr:FAD-dependent oxidoreductase [Aliifodinibius sp. S!AR15-10]MDR8390235.1 NAD(P)-binding protein [Aliifodinibius sp. S!AR15-10]